MNTHKFYPLQEPQPEEFDEAFVDSAYNLLRRFGSLVTPGIVPAPALYALTQDLRWFAMMPDGKEFNLVQNGALAYNVGPGMAFSRNAVSTVGDPYDASNPTDLRTDRIFISPTDSAVVYNGNNPDNTDVLGNAIPKSTGCTSIPVLANRTYYVYVRYLQAVDTLTNNPADSGNKYTLNPQTGQVSYVHRVDGYQIVHYVNAASVNPDDIFLGTITVGASAITSIDMSGRTYFSLLGSLVSSEIRSTQISPFILRPESYDLDVPVSFTDHINAVSDLSEVSLYNPHGLTMGNIPGLLDRFGMFSDAPQDFITNGIIDRTTDVASNRPGPYWPHVQGLSVYLNLPVADQAIVMEQYRYDSNSVYFSEVLSGSELVLQNFPGSIAAQFPLGSGLRPTGLYFVYMERAIVSGVSGLAFRAIKAVRFDLGPVSVEDMLRSPEAYLNLQTQFPVGILNWSSSAGFIAFTSDPQTRYSAAPFYIFDVRRYGTISETNISHDRRSYTGSTSEVPQSGTLPRNKEIYSDFIRWHMLEPITVMVIKPKAQALVKKSGWIRRVTMFVDSLNMTTGTLKIDIKRNGVTSIFSTLPAMPAGRAFNTTNYTGAPNTGIIMDITESAAVSPDVGQLNPDAVYVNAGDRLMLTITDIGNSPAGDLQVSIYIE